MFEIGLIKSYWFWNTKFWSCGYVWDPYGKEQACVIMNDRTGDSRALCLEKLIPGIGADHQWLSCL